VIFVVACGSSEPKPEPSKTSPSPSASPTVAARHAKRRPDLDESCKPDTAWEYRDGSLGEAEGCKGHRIYKKDDEIWFYCCPAGDPKLAMWDVFPAFPGATHVCDQHVASNTGHIEWSSYATTEDDGSVASFVAAFLAHDMSHEFVIGDSHLEVHAIGDKGIPSCETKPPADAKTLIIVSKMIH
jgi:hypothetical protein